MKSLLCLALLCTFLKANATNYYFSSLSGDDSRTATQAQNPSTPWQTLTKFNSYFSSIAAGDSMLLKRGETFYGTMAPGRSGVNDNYIIIGTFGTGANPVIRGTTDLTWFNVTGNIWRCNQSLTQSSINLVTINDVPVAMGRYPNAGQNNATINAIDGYLEFESRSGSTSITDTEMDSDTNWSTSNAKIVLRAARWYLDPNDITAHSGSTISYTAYKGHGPDDSEVDGYFIQNDIRTLNAQNEWYFDAANDYMSMYSVGAPANVRVSNVNSLFSSTSRSYIAIFNIDFIGAEQRVIDIFKGSGIVFTNCLIKNSGRDGFYTTGNSTYLVNSTVENSLNTGIKVIALSNHATLSNAESEGDDKPNDDAVWGLDANITNCYIHSSHALEGMGQPGDDQGDGIFTNAPGTVIERNRVVNTGYAGIHFKRNNDLLISFNLVDTFCFNKDDGGGIYGVNSRSGSAAYATTNRVVSYNIIMHGIGALAGAVSNISSAHGFYMDNNTNGVLGIYNFIAFCARGIYSHRMARCTLRYNFSYGNLQGFVSKQDNTTYFSVDNVMKYNIFMSLHTSMNSNNNAVYFQKHADLANSAIDNFGTVDSNYYSAPRMTDASSAIIYNNSSTLLSLSGWQAVRPHDDNTSVAPYFYNSQAKMDTSFRVEINTSFSSVTRALQANYVDDYGNVYNRSITIPGMSARGIYKTSPLTDDPPPSTQKNYIRSSKKPKG